MTRSEERVIVYYKSVNIFFESQTKLFFCFCIFLYKFVINHFKVNRKKFTRYCLSAQINEFFVSKELSFTFLLNFFKEGFITFLVTLHVFLMIILLSTLYLRMETSFLIMELNGTISQFHSSVDILRKI